MPSMTLRPETSPSAQNRPREVAFVTPLLPVAVNAHIWRYGRTEGPWSRMT